VPAPQHNGQPTNGKAEKGKTDMNVRKTVQSHAAAK